MSAFRGDPDLSESGGKPIQLFPEFELSVNLLSVLYKSKKCIISSNENVLKFKDIL